MAQLAIESDPYLPGRWTIRSDNLSALAAVPDAISQVLGLQDEALAAWALHPDEQAGIRDAAYHDELSEIGIGPLVEVRELARPWQQNVVWVDRYHLLVASAPTGLGSRLLGLYAGSQGRIVLMAYHPSMAGVVHQELANMPNASGKNWEGGELINQCTFVLRYESTSPQAVDLRAPQPRTAAIQDALGRLTLMVAGW